METVGAKDTALNGLFSFLERAVSPFHAAAEGARLLAQAGYFEWNGTEREVRVGSRFFVRAYGSALLAFSIGENPRARLRIAAAHTDFPCLRVKPHAAMRERGYGKLNVEVYGGMIRSSWLDRPLSLAGKVAMRGDDPYIPVVREFDARRPLLIIPSLAIHMNRDVNKGVELNPQKDLLPLFTMEEDEADGDFF